MHSSDDIQVLFEKLATSLRKNVEEYFATWQKPMKYRFVMNGYSPRLPKGVQLDTFSEYVTTHGYVQVLRAPSGRRFVVPTNEFLKSYAFDSDTLLESLIDTDEQVDKDAIRKRQEVRDKKI